MTQEGKMQVGLRHQGSESKKAAVIVTQGWEDKLGSRKIGLMVAQQPRRVIPPLT